MSSSNPKDGQVIKKVAGGCLVRVRATTGASRAQVRCVENGELKVYVHAPPDKGRANEEIITVLSQFFGVNKSRVAIVRGSSVRSKQVIIKELDHDIAMQTISSL
jgi:uncharacterized protein (TIGR00251 family)